MKNLTRNVLSTIAIAGIASFASAETVYEPADNSKLSKLCVSAAMDTKVDFNLSMNRSRLTDRYIRTNVSCNGMTIAQFAKEAGNLQNFYMLEVNPDVRIDIYQTAQTESDSERKVVLVAGE